LMPTAISSTLHVAMQEGSMQEGLVAWMSELVTGAG
jgi:hypothetical protein